jgi:hypothetical protein
VVPERGQSATEGGAELVRGVGWLSLGLLLLGRLILGRDRLQSAGVPQIDVQPLDLLDQKQDRAAGGPHLVTAVTQQTLAPGPQGLDLVLVEPVRRESLLLVCPALTSICVKRPFTRVIHL